MVKWPCIINKTPSLYFNIVDNLNTVYVVYVQLTFSIVISSTHHHKCYDIHLLSQALPQLTFILLYHLIMAAVVNQICISCLFLSLPFMLL